MTTRVGVLLVHGIGEQRRFEHLEAEARQIVSALEATQDTLPKDQRARVTVDVRTSADAGFKAEQQTWLAEDAASVRVDVLYPTGDLTEIHFREVWWADLDEPADPWHRIRFWAWGFSQWALRGFRKSPLSGASQMFLPGNPDQRPRKIKLFDRARLFSVGIGFVLILGTITVLGFVARRLGFKLANPGPDRLALGPEILVKYVGDVKLYQQRKWLRQGALEDRGYPPRVAIRRRVVRALVDMALEKYDRWYVLAHSLGTVAAFNGLMESGHCLPNYLDKKRWVRCQIAGIGGAKSGNPPGGTSKMMPHRPAWLDDDDVIYRGKLFDNLLGFLTYGCPLDKFATLWPAIVPLNKDQAVFRGDFTWINVFDAVDPVAGGLDSFFPDDTISPIVEPGTGKKAATPENLSYKAHWFFALSHIRYTKFVAGNCDCLVSKVANWLLNGGSIPAPESSQGRWLDVSGGGTRRRSVYRYMQWGVVALLMALAIAWWAFPATEFVIDLLGKPPVLSEFVSWLEALLGGLTFRLFSVIFVAALIVVLAGFFRKLRHWSAG